MIKEGAADATMTAFNPVCSKARRRSRNHQMAALGEAACVDVGDVFAEGGDRGKFEGGMKKEE